VARSFFRIEHDDGNEVFLGNDPARGPWDPDSCHAGPPAALLARACERAMGLPGPTTMWMRTVPVLDSEEPTPFQRICPLADSGNAIGRNAEPEEVAFVNADLTITLHRKPRGPWLGSRVISHWQQNGIGMADAMLFDDHGPVGRAVQTLLLRKVA
jgi:hypothetical protein